MRAVPATRVQARFVDRLEGWSEHAPGCARRGGPVVRPKVDGRGIHATATLLKARGRADKRTTSHGQLRTNALVSAVGPAPWLHRRLWCNADLPPDPDR